MIGGFERASQSMYDRTASWIAIADRMWSLVPNNSIFNMRVTPGGLVGQYSAFGNFKLAPGETMLIEFGTPARLTWEFSSVIAGSLVWITKTTPAP